MLVQWRKANRAVTGVSLNFVSLFGLYVDIRIGNERELMNRPVICISVDRWTSHFHGVYVVLCCNDDNTRGPID